MWELTCLVIRGKSVFNWNTEDEAALRIKIVNSEQPRLFLRVSQAADYRLQKEKVICLKCSTNCLLPANRQGTRLFQINFWVLSLSFLILVLSLIPSSFTTCFHFLSFEMYKLWGSEALLYAIHLFVTYFTLMSNCAVSNLSNIPINVFWVWRTKFHTCNELHTKLRFLIRLFIIVFFKILGHAVAQLVQAMRYKPWSRGFDF